MGVGEIYTIIYFVIGIVLTCIWWNDEYKYEYEARRENNDVEEPMAVLLLLGLIFFWPVKLFKIFLESFIGT